METRTRLILEFEINEIEEFLIHLQNIKQKGIALEGILFSVEKAMIYELLRPKK